MQHNIAMGSVSILDWAGRLTRNFDKMEKLFSPNVITLATVGMQTEVE